MEKAVINEMGSRIKAKNNIKIQTSEAAERSAKVAEQDRRQAVDPEVAKMATGVKDLAKLSQGNTLDTLTGKGRRKSRKTRRGRKSRKRTVRKYY